MKKILSVILLLGAFSMANAKTLVVYFSNTYGNTKNIAEQIHAKIGGDIVRLETVTPYPSDYNKLVDQGYAEVRRAYKPELKPLGVNTDDYDTIIVGTPTWWYKMSSPVLSFMSSVNWSGKKVAVFSTNAGWTGTALKDMEKAASPAECIGSFSVQFKGYSDKAVTPQKDIDGWIDSLAKKVNN